MLHNHEYVAEKLRSFELEALARRALADLPAKKRRPLIGPVVFLTGSRIKRFGQLLEDWGAPEAAVSPDLTP